MSQNATLKDIAEFAGVSISAVSQALNNQGNLAPATRARIIEAAAALHYPIIKEKSGDNARSSLHTVGLLKIHDQGDPLSVNPFYAAIQQGVESECLRQDISLMVASVEVDAQKRPLVWPPIVHDTLVDGFLLAGAIAPEQSSLLQKIFLGRPVILVDSYTNAPFDSVLADNFGGAVSATQYLINQGHRAIGFIGDATPQAHPSHGERLSGFRHAMRQNNLGEGEFEQTPALRTAAGEAAQRLLTRAPHITAIFATNDDCAIGILHAAQLSGRHIPGDLSLIGFDNIDLAQAIALTTINVNIPWLGIIGVDHLCARAQNPSKPAITTRVATSLVVRNTVKAI
jgi:LacI family transcriptional regulator